MKELIFTAIVVFGSVVGKSVAWAQNKVDVIEFTVSECTEPLSNSSMFRTRIIDKNHDNGIFIVRIATIETCCLEFKPTVKYFSSKGSVSDTLYLGYKSRKDPCECECYYEFVYKLKTASQRFEIQFRGSPIEETIEPFKTYPIKYNVLGTDTINLIDKYGLRQGLWIFDSLEHYYFQDNEPIREILFFKNGNIKRDSKKEYGNWNYQVEYFETGEMRRQCLNTIPGESFRNGKCKEWDILGKLVYEGQFKY